MDKSNAAKYVKLVFEIVLIRAENYKMRTHLSNYNNDVNVLPQYFLFSFQMIKFSNPFLNIFLSIEKGVGGLEGG